MRTDIEGEEKTNTNDGPDIRQKYFDEDDQRKPTMDTEIVKHLNEVDQIFTGLGDLNRSFTQSQTKKYRSWQNCFETEDSITNVS